MSHFLLVVCCWIFPIKETYLGSKKVENTAIDRNTNTHTHTHICHDAVFRKMSVNGRKSFRHIFAYIVSNLITWCFYRLRREIQVWISCQQISTNDVSRWLENIINKSFYWPANLVWHLRTFKTCKVERMKRLVKTSKTRINGMQYLTAGYFHVKQAFMHRVADWLFFAKRIWQPCFYM